MKHAIIAILVLLIAGTGSVMVKAGQNVSGVVNVNTATKAELMMVPGIGEVKASAILELRSKRPFQSREDLLAIKGVGEKLLERISSYVVTKGETTLKNVP